MNIDKASFLLLAGAISAGACTIVSGSGDDDDGGTAGNGSGASGATTADGGTGGAGGAGGAMGGAGGGTCDDSVGTAADCTLAMTSCTEGVALIDDITLCNVASDYFKPGVAEEATNCIVNLDTASTCDDVLICRDQALNNACDDDVSVECAALVLDCGGLIDQGECESILPGFSEAGRTAVVTQCGPATEGCLLGGVYTDLLECVDNMLPAP